MLKTRWPNMRLQRYADRTWHEMVLLTTRTVDNIVNPEISEGGLIMARPVEVKALPSFRIWLRYDDGIIGEIDLSDLDICSDAMYLRLTGKSPEEIFPSLGSIHADA